MSESFLNGLTWGLGFWASFTLLALILGLAVFIYDTAVDLAPRRKR